MTEIVNSPNGSEFETASEKIETASAAILKAIDKCQEENFKTMTLCMTKYKWSSYFFYGSDISTVGKGNFKFSDPRKNEDYQNFASSNQVQKYFIYYDSDNVFKLGNINEFVQWCDDNFVICKTYVQELENTLEDKTDFDKIETLYDSPTFQMCQKLSRMYAGIDFWGKKSALEEYLNSRKAPYAFNKNQINELCTNQFKNNYNDSFKSLSVRTTSYDELKNNVGGFYIDECSFAPKELKEEYEKTKEEYNKNVQQLFKLLAGSPSLTVCYNQATQAGNNYDVM